MKLHEGFIAGNYQPSLDNGIFDTKHFQVKFEVHICHLQEKHFNTIRDKLLDNF